MSNWMRVSLVALMLCLASLVGVTHFSGSAFAQETEASDETQDTSEPPTETSTDVVDEAADEMEGVVDEASEGNNSETAYYLYMLFGDLVDYGGADDQVQTILGVYIQYLNYAVVGLGSLLLGYFVVVGLVQTSADGEILGKQWSSTWVPVRTTLAAAGMVPLPSGYLAIQVLIMKIALVFVGVSDWTQEKVISKYIDGGVSISAAAPPDSHLPVVAVTKMMLCQRTLEYTERQLWLIQRKQSPKPVSVTIKETVTTDETDAGLEYSKTRIGGDRIKDNKVREAGVCGSIEYSQRVFDNEEQTDVGFRSLETISEPIYQSHLTALRKLLRENGEIDQLVDVIASVSYPNKERDYKPTREELKSVKAAYEKAVSVYRSEVLSKAQSVVSDLRQSSAKANALKQKMMDGGWLHAGSYYMTLASLNREVFEATSFTPTYSPPISPQPSNGPDANNVAYNSAMQVFDGFTRMIGADSDFTPVYDFKRSYNDTIRDEEKGGDDLGEFALSALGMLNSYLGEFASMIEFGKGYQDKYEAGDAKYYADALGELTFYGNFWLNLMLTVIGFFVVMSLVAKLGSLTFAGKLMGMIGKLSSKLSGGSGSIGSFGIGIGMLVGFILSLSFTGAVYLAIILPAMPYIIWTTAVVGWYILVTEAVIGSAFWAVAHLMPSGEGLSGDSGRDGWKILLNIAIRPQLMLGGLYGGLGIFAMVSTYYFITWDYAVNDILMGRSAGFLTRVIFAIMFIGILVAMSERCFRFITWLPDTVLRWLGAKAESIMDEREDEKQRNLIMAGAGRGGQAINRGTMGALAMGQGGQKLSDNNGGPAGSSGGDGGGAKDASAMQGVSNTASNSALSSLQASAGGAGTQGSEGAKRSSEPTEVVANKSAPSSGSRFGPPDGDDA